MCAIQTEATDVMPPITLMEYHKMINESAEQEKQIEMVETACKSENNLYILF